MIRTLDHVNVRTARLDEMVAWYADVLDMHKGARPPFTMGGAWLYAGSNPIVHLVEVASEPASVDPKIEHFALSASGMDGFLERLDARGIDYSLDPVPNFPIVQVNLLDPDGNHIHVDFSIEEAPHLPA